MKIPDDTGFYCYRAIEALRQYCIVRYKLDPDRKSDQWSKVREVAGCDEHTLRDIKAAADPVRHGAIVPITDGDRQALFAKTWDVMAFSKRLTPIKPARSMGKKIQSRKKFFFLRLASSEREVRLHFSFVQFGSA